MTEEQFSKMSYSECLELVRLYVQRIDELEDYLWENIKPDDIAFVFQTPTAKRIDELLSRP